MKTDENVRIAVAIDGPAGAGKSSIARCAAAELGFLYIDTGALYRALGLYMLENGTDPGSPEKVLPLLSGAEISLRSEDGEQRVFLNGRDVTAGIRSPQVSMAASKVSAIPEVRSFLLGLQRSFAETQNVVMDGRDIGTVVLPQAQVKIFLTASAGDRARRRYEEMLSKGETADYSAVLRDLEQRDYNDTHRAAAPLRAADDAVLVDTTGNTFEQSVSQLIGIIREHLPKT